MTAERSRIQKVQPTISTSTVRAGERTDPSGRPVRNVILLSIPDVEYNSLRPRLEFVELNRHENLEQPGGKIDFGYFLNEGMASVVVATSDGRSVEVGIIGKEGFVGALLVVGLNRSPYRVVVQVPGDGLRVKAEDLERTLAACPYLQLMLNRFVHMQGVQMAQIAACNRLHELEQRLARWLLMSQDRVDSQWLPVTHDFLATMLGTGRPSVSLAASILQRDGLIEYVRGAVRVLDRKGLENAACECYRVIQQFNGGLGLK